MTLQQRKLFFEPSTRTHYSFDMAALKLGCRTQNFNAGDSSIKKGETLYDTVKTFEMFGVDAVVIRHKENEYYNQLVGKLIIQGTEQEIILLNLY